MTDWKDYTILMPMMLDPHFEILAKILQDEGYNVKILRTSGAEIITHGLENVHNDMCYPALLVIGQFIEALKSERFDNKKVALLISQTGGGCRASNYIYLLRKALENSGFSDIPVISINSNKMDENSLHVPKILFFKLLAAVYYGDLMMCLYNFCASYEKTSGETQKALIDCLGKINAITQKWEFFRISKNFKRIIERFLQIELTGEKKPSVGIVGEIYMQYSPLGNNNLAKYLISEGAEVVNNGLLSFLLSSIYDTINDKKIYGKGGVDYVVAKILVFVLERIEKKMIKMVKKAGKFRAPTEFGEIKKLANGYIDYGVKMGEGWLLTAEMVAYITNGVKNIISVQPFGCLPNQIIAKGMIRKIKSRHEDANIIAIDYDAGVSQTNQENRIKLMLAVARRGI